MLALRCESHPTKEVLPFLGQKRERAIGDRIKLNRYAAGNWGGGGQNRSKMWYVFLTVNCWTDELIDRVTDLVTKWLIGRDLRFGPACRFFLATITDISLSLKNKFLTITRSQQRCLTSTTPYLLQSNLVQILGLFQTDLVM